MGIPDHLTCLLGKLCQGQEATVRTEHGMMNWFKIGKGLCQAWILSPCLLNLYAEYIMWNARLQELQTGIKIAVKNINYLWYVDDTILMAENEELKTLDEGERGQWKSWLKPQHLKNQDHSIWSHHLRENRRENMWTVTLFIFLGSKTTADSECSHKIKIQLLIGRKATPNLDTILKSRDINLLTTSLWSKLWFFEGHVWMWVGP